MHKNLYEAKALANYYRELGNRARDAVNGLPGCDNVMSVAVSIGSSNIELVDCPFHSAQDESFARMILFNIENFCIQRAQEIDAQVQAWSCK